MEAIVLLADVRGSRRVADRSGLAGRIRKALAAANLAAGRHLAGRFDVSKGVDEFSGVLRPGAPLGRILAGLWEDLHPVPVRLAAVRGAIDVTPPRRRRVPRTPSARFFDGPAFHVASRLLVDLSPGRGLLALRLGREERRERVAAMLGTALYLHVLGWTTRQLEVAQAYRERGTQLAAARRLRVSQPTVSGTLAATRAIPLLPSFDAFRLELDSLAEA